MRLTCPNCEAQYEVPDEVIPASGRDVQCSNCGDTWFQPHPDHGDVEPEGDDESQNWDAPPSEDTQEAEAEIADAELVEDDETAQDPAPEEDADDPQEQEESAPAPQRRELDSSVTDVLREEADRERAARQEEAAPDGLETQPDLGLDSRDDEVERRSREAQARMARLRGEAETEDAPTVADLDPGTRRNLLPDIDEINSSLSSDSVESQAADVGDVETAPVPTKSGFRRGFLTIVLLAVIGLLLYMFAPQLTESVPALKPTLMSYVEMINQLRAWLNTLVSGWTGNAEG